MSKHLFQLAAIMALSLVCADAAYAASPTYFQQQLTSPNSAKGDLLGAAVAVSGNLALVGASHQTVSRHSSRGEVYVFTYQDGTWTETAELTASDGTVADSFGASVAVSGTTALIGSPGHKNKGAAYIFTESGGTWTQKAELTSSDTISQDEFGGSVALDGDTAVIGAYQHGSLEGDAYIYTKPAAGWKDTSAFDAELTASDAAHADEFGTSVAVSGDVVVVGSPSHQVGGNPQQGQVYVFLKHGGGWATTATADALLTSNNSGAMGLFGDAVATSGSAIIVGEPTYSVGPISTGAAFIYAKPSMKTNHRERRRRN